MDTPDEIWNRAAMADAPEQLTKAGDRNLAALLRAHSEIMSGGMDFAINDSLEADEMAAACAGFEYFARSDVAGVLRRASLAKGDEDALAGLEDDYYELVPTDDDLVQMFEAHFDRRPDDFAALDA